MVGYDAAVRWLLVALLLLLPAGPVSASDGGIGPRRHVRQRALVFRDAGGPQGIYIDLLKEIGRKQGWTRATGDLGRVPAAAGAGEIDLLVAIGYSEERTRRSISAASPWW
jgi:hypothetical protein